MLKEAIRKANEKGLDLEVVKHSQKVLREEVERVIGNSNAILADQAKEKIISEIIRLAGAN